MSRFFTKPVDVIDGNTIYAKDVNDLSSTSDTGFNLVEGEMDELQSVTDTQVELAKRWAEEDHLVEVIPGKYSSISHATDSEASKVAAALSETNASTSETNAALSETNASTSETNASTSEANASASETNASASETNALASKVKAEEWAEKAEDTEVETGEYSAHHWANKASSSASSINLPTLSSGDEGKMLEVNGTHDGYDLTTGAVQGVSGTSPISVDNTDPKNPVISSSAGQVDTVVAGDRISIDSTDPVSPIVSFTGSTVLPRVSEYLLGNIQGLSYSYTTANTITITKGNCYDSTATVVLSLSADSTISIPTGINTIYSLFLCDDGVIRTDTDVDGATLLGGSTTELRWIGYVLTDSAGDISPFELFGDTILNYSSGFVLMSRDLPAAYTQVDFSASIPLERHLGVRVGLVSYTETGAAYLSVDGTDNTMYHNLLGSVGATRDRQATVLFKHGWYVKANSTDFNNVDLVAKEILLKR